MDTNIFPGNIRAGGTVYAAAGFEPAITRLGLAQESLRPFAIRATDWRVHDAAQTPLPGTAATDDLEIATGAIGTSPLTIRGGDMKALGATTRYARAQVPIPNEYVSGQTLVLRFSASMKTTVADVSCTLDVQAYSNDEDDTVSADLCATAAHDINGGTSYSDYDFTITPTSLVAGQTLDVRIAIACNDAETATAVIPIIGASKLLCDCKG